MHERERESEVSMRIETRGQETHEVRSINNYRVKESERNAGTLEQ